MKVRRPVVAGQFYSDGREGCLAELKECLGRKVGVGLPEEIAAGIVPHAGWVFSGELAGMVFSAIKQVHEEVDTFVIFGAAHRYAGRDAVVYPDGKWETPLGVIEVDGELAGSIIDIDCARGDREAHSGEHSIEVQVPFIQYLFEGARIVPILVRPAEFDVRLGTETGRIIKEAKGKRIVCIASTDLTHYGPRYGFCPEGTGREGLKWAKEVNDRMFIELALGMEPHRLLETAAERSNACGAGAAAAAIGAAKELGKMRGILLGHEHSNDVMERKFGRWSEESVGYAAIIF
jgi:hypothetical protein